MFQRIYYRDEEEISFSALSIIDRIVYHSQHFNDWPFKFLTFIKSTQINCTHQNSSKVFFFFSLPKECLTTFIAFSHFLTQLAFPLIFNPIKCFILSNKKKLQHNSLCKCNQTCFIFIMCKANLRFILIQQNVHINEHKPIQRSITSKRNR